ncbi:MAG TPA: preprotein translocase subunit SecE [Pseudonocardiaceae bacterium]
MSEDRPEQDEQDPADDNQDSSSSRPDTAAARRERRAAGSRPPARSGDPKSSATGGRTTLSGRREERVSVFARLARFLREVVAELRKVIWPTRKELVTYTIVVLVFVSFMVAFVYGLDAVFAWSVFQVFG